MHLVLGFLRQTTVSHVVQVTRYLHLHAVADLLVFFDTAEGLGKLRIVSLGIEVFDHVQHAVGADRKDVNLFPCLEDRELRGGHQTAGDELELAFVLFLSLLLRNNLTYQRLHLWHKADEDNHVAHVERGVEGGQDGIQLVRADVRYLTRRERYAPNMADSANKPAEDA